MGHQGELAIAWPILICVRGKLAQEAKLLDKDSWRREKVF